MSDLVAKKLVSVVAVSPEILGYYLDNPIHQFIETDDGRFFVWESIAVYNHDAGAYYVDHAQEDYIVYQNMLYREVKT